MEENQQKTWMYIGIVVIVLLLAGVAITINSNLKTKKSLNAEKLSSEKLLSEKLSAEKELEKLKANFSALQIKSDASAKLLAETNLKIAEAQKRINSLTVANRSLNTVKKELEDLQKVKADLEKELAQSKTDYNNLQAKNKELQNTIASLEADMKSLTLKLENALKYNTDNFLVTAVRGKKTEKMVIKATRTKKLNITFEVPKSLTEGISFKIVTPSGSVITPDDKGLSWIFPLDGRNLTASLSAVSGQFEESRQVALTYTAEKKLVSGEYKIQIFCNGNNIGNCKIKLK
jgi:predicted  nucleic acid-binding Zn-ribbon protein